MSPSRSRKSFNKSDSGSVGEVDPAGYGSSDHECNPVLRVTQAMPTPSYLIPQAGPLHHSRYLSGAAGTSSVPLNSQGINPQSYTRSTISSSAKASPGVSVKGSGSIVRSDVAAFRPGNSFNNFDASRGNPAGSSLNPGANQQWGHQGLPSGGSSSIVRSDAAGRGLTYRPGNSTHVSDATRGNQASSGFMPRANIPFGCQVQAGQGSSELSFRPGNQSRWSLNPQANLRHGSQDLAGQGSSGLSFGSGNSMNNSNATQGNQSRWSFNPQANLRYGRQNLAGQDSSEFVVKTDVSGSGLAFRPGNSTNNSDATRGNQASLSLNPRVNLQYGSQGLAGQGSSGFAFRPGSSTNNFDATRGNQASCSLHPPANVQCHSQGLGGRGSRSIDKSGLAASGLAFKAGNSVINSDATRGDPASCSSNPRANLQWDSQVPAGPAGKRIDNLEPLGISPEANMHQEIKQQIKQPTRTSSRLAAKAAEGLTRPSNAESYPAMRTKGKTNAARRSHNTQPLMDSQSGRLAKHLDLPKEKYPANSSSKDKHVTSSTSQSKRIKSPHAAASCSVTKGKAATVSAHTTPVNHFLATWGIKKTRSSLSQMQEEEEAAAEEEEEEEAVHDPLSYHIKWNVSDTFEDPELRTLGERCQLCHLDLVFPQGASSSYSDDPAIHAVLPCRHCFHYSCLVSIYGKPEPSQTPTCFACSVR